MDFMQRMQGNLQRKGEDLTVKRVKLDISPAGIIKLNNQIEQMVEEDRVMLEASPGKAARYACSR